MPRLDYALLGDYVRAEGGIAHVISAGIDTVRAAQVPAGQNIGLLLRLAFTRSECGRPHRLEVLFQDIDGERLAELNGTMTPEWREHLPAGWDTSVLMGVNMAIPLPRYGLYAFEILVNDTHMKTVQLRVVEPDPPPE